MENFLRTISDSLSGMVSNVSINTLLIIMLSIIFGVCLLCGLWDAFSTIAQNSRKIKKLCKVIDTIDIEQQETELIESISKIKGMKQPFMRFVAEPEEAPSKYFHYDEVAASKSCIYSKIIFSLISALVIVVSAIFSAVYINVSAMSSAIAFIFLACEIATFAILYSALSIINHIRLARLHFDYYLLVAGLDRITESKVEDYYLAEDDEDDDKKESLSEEKSADVTNSIHNSTNVQAYDVFEDYKTSVRGQSIRPVQVQRASLDRKTELKYQNPYLKDDQANNRQQEQGIVGKPLQAEKGYVTTNSIQNAAQEFVKSSNSQQQNSQEQAAKQSGYVHAGTTYRYSKSGVTSKEETLFEGDDEVARAANVQNERFASHAKKAVDEENAENKIAKEDKEPTKEENVVIDGQISMQNNIFENQASKPPIEETQEIKEPIQPIVEDTNPQSIQTHDDKELAAQEQKEQDEQDDSIGVTVQNLTDVINKALTEKDDEQVFADKQDDKEKIKQDLEQQKKELQDFLKKSKGKSSVKPMDIVAKARIAIDISNDDEDSQRTRQQIALLLHKENEKNTSKSPDEQKRMNAALADLMRAMGRKK